MIASLPTGTRTCPSAYATFRERSSLRLTHEEAGCLQARILTAVPDSLPTWVVGLEVATNIEAPR